MIVLEDHDDHSYRKLVLRDATIAGAIVMGRQQDAALVTEAAKERRDVSALIEDLEQGDWSCLASRHDRAALAGS